MAHTTRRNHRFGGALVLLIAGGASGCSTYTGFTGHSLYRIGPHPFEVERVAGPDELEALPGEQRCGGVYWGTNYTLSEINAFQLPPIRSTHDWKPHVMNASLSQGGGTPLYQPSEDVAGFLQYIERRLRTRRDYNGELAQPLRRAAAGPNAEIEDRVEQILAGSRYRSNVTFEVTPEDLNGVTVHYVRHIGRKREGGTVNSTPFTKSMPLGKYEFIAMRHGKEFARQTLWIEGETETVSFDYGDENGLRS